MYSNPDLYSPRSLSLFSKRFCLGCAAAASAFLLASCGLNPSRMEREAPKAGQSAPPVAQAPALPASEPAPPPPPPAPPPPPPAPDPVARVLAYAERVRAMPAAELSQEAARLNAPAENVVPVNQVQLSLVLSQMRQLPELIRAQELLAKVLANGNADAQPLHPLARLLAFRYGEQRRLEGDLERERQQTRDVQRRLDQTSERLEALKAIERSLTSRPPAPPTSAPTSAPASAPASAPVAAPRRRPSAP
jgi:hypothetical protein